MRGEGSESVGLFLSDLCQPKIGETVIFERKQKIHQHCGLGLGALSWQEFCSVLWEVGQTRILLATLCLAFFCGGVSQTIVGNWSCTSIEFRIVLVVGIFVFNCIRWWKRFSLSVQDLFLQTMWCDCFVYFCVFCIVVLLFPTFWEFVWCRVQHLCKPEIAGNLGGRRKTKNSNKPKLKRQIQSLKWEQRKTWKWFKLLTCSEAVTRSSTFTTQANAF